MSAAEIISENTATQPEAAPDTPLIEARGLRKHFVTKRPLFGKPTIVRAVDGVDLSVRRGETFSIVGESGCGKSTLARLLIRLLDPSAGSVIYEGKDIAALPEAEMRRLRRDLQFIFQDPFSSLNPRMTIGGLVEEPMRAHGIHDPKQRREEVAKLLRRVGLRPEYADRYPHEFSGGQRQRIGIARALATGPKLLIGDEPVSALDVSVRAQILNLMKRIQQQTSVGYVIVSHDLGAIRYICHRVAVMYLGRVVEEGPVETVFRDPQHPYTQVLVSAVPVPRVHGRKPRMVLQGEVPSPVDPPPGCHFHTRCPFAIARCRAEVPALRDIGGGRKAACHLLAGESDPVRPATILPKPDATAPTAAPRA